MLNNLLDLFVSHTIRKGNVVFNKTLSTFYLWLYGIEHVFKDHRYNERKPTATTSWATLSDLTARDILYAPSHIQDGT